MLAAFLGCTMLIFCMYWSAQGVNNNTPTVRESVHSIIAGMLLFRLRVLLWVGRVERGSVSTPGAHWASFSYHSPRVPVFAPTSPTNLEYLLAVSKEFGPSFALSL